MAVRFPTYSVGDGLEALDIERCRMQTMFGAQLYNLYRVLQIFEVSCLYSIPDVITPLSFQRRIADLFRLQDGDQVLYLLEEFIVGDNHYAIEAIPEVLKGRELCAVQFA